MVSNKQLEANRKNAKLGGIKTPEGKEVSKFNAVTHGILQQSITDYEKGFYFKILNDLKNQYNPEGIIEQILLDRISVYYLKLYRVQRAETEFMKNTLNPIKFIKVGGMNLDRDIDAVIGKRVAINEGYEPVLKETSIQTLMETYTKYEITIENRLFRAIHELERVLRLRGGEKILPPIAADITQMGSFGEND